MGTITKALTLLSHFSSDRGEIGLASFVRLSGGDKATVRRHLLELEANGFLQQHPETRKYRLGPALLRLASVREIHAPILGMIKPVVDKIAADLGELVHASLLQGDVMSPVYHSDPARHALRVVFDQGEMLPLHATASGLAMLAFGPDGMLDTVLSRDLPSFAPNTVITRSDLVHMVKQFRQQGFSYSDQHFTKGVVSLGVPFFGPDGDATGTLAVPLPLSRLSDVSQPRVLSMLHDGCRAITQSCGGTVPDSLTEIWNRIPQVTNTRNDEDL